MFGSGLLGRGIPVFAGRQAGMLPKCPIEIGGIVKATFQGNIQNICLIVLIQQHRNGPIDPFGDDVIPRGDLKEILKQRG